MVFASLIIGSLLKKVFCMAGAGLRIYSLAFILGGYGKCRSCCSGRSKCLSCEGFEGRVRRSYVKNKYIIKCLDERITVFGTAWYQLNHSAIRVVSS